MTSHNKIPPPPPVCMLVNLSPSPWPPLTLRYLWDNTADRFKTLTSFLSSFSYYSESPFHSYFPGGYYGQLVSLSDSSEQNWGFMDKSWSVQGVPSCWWVNQRPSSPWLHVCQSVSLSLFLFSVCLHLPLLLSCLTRLALCNSFCSPPCPSTFYHSFLFHFIPVHQRLS